MIWLLLLIALFLIYYWFKFRRCKGLNNLPNITLFTGGVKVGKTAVSLVYTIRVLYKRVLRRYYFQKYILFKKNLEKPIIYSNIPLANIDYVQIDLDYILRNYRSMYKSVTYIDECSLLADSMAYKDKEVNAKLMLFNKLYGHATHGGYLIYNTQSLQDCHFSIKRCISSYIYIHRLIKLPFFCIAVCREMLYTSDSDNVINVVDSEDKSEFKYIIFRKSIFKMYDSYCYSVLTDNLPVKDEVKHIKVKGYNKGNKLKYDKVISLNDDLNKLIDDERKRGVNNE